MELYDKYFWGVMALGLGASSAIPAVQAFVKYRSIRGTVVWSLLGAAFLITGLLNLMQVITREWTAGLAMAFLGFHFFYRVSPHFTLLLHQVICAGHSGRCWYSESFAY